MLGCLISSENLYNYLKILVLSLSPLLCSAQITYESLIYHPIWKTYDVNHKDTIKCDLLISVGQDVKIIVGYYVSYAFRATKYSEIVYLDERKKKLPKEVKVWMSHSKQ